MGFGVNEKLDKQAKYRKKNGKSKVKVIMKQPKGKQPANVSKIKD
jgi:hypothetical protein